MPRTHVFAVIEEFLASTPPPSAVLSYRLSEALEHRALELLTRQRDSLLSEEETQELLDFIRTDDLMTLLKAKLRSMG